MAKGKKSYSTKTETVQIKDKTGQEAPLDLQTIQITPELEQLLKKRFDRLEPDEQLLVRRFTLERRLTRTDEDVYPEELISDMRRELRCIMDDPERWKKVIAMHNHWPASTETARSRRYADVTGN